MHKKMNSELPHLFFGIPIFAGPVFFVVGNVVFIYLRGLSVFCKHIFPTFFLLPRGCNCFYLIKLELCNRFPVLKKTLFSDPKNWWQHCI